MSKHYVSDFLQQVTSVTSNEQILQLLLID